jgi:RNA polymerase sigma-54 factor
MALLQPRLNLRVSQKQILTPGLVQMVSVLALNKLELKDMITAEMVENPVLEELESSIPLLDDIARKEEERERTAVTAEAPAVESAPEAESGDSFDQIDMDSFFQEYLDPGYRSRQEWESIEKPSFENFLSRPSTLTDHLTWQLHAMHLRPPVAEAGEVIIGNLEEDGYLTASDEELLGIAPPKATEVKEEVLPAADPEIADDSEFNAVEGTGSEVPVEVPSVEAAATAAPTAGEKPFLLEHNHNGNRPGTLHFAPPTFNREDLNEALELVRSFDPVGCASRDLRECLLAQLKYHQQLEMEKNGEEGELFPVLKDCIAIIGDHLKPLQNKLYKEIARAIDRPLEAVMSATEYIKTLDPKPGLRYNIPETRLIEPDVAFVKDGDQYLVLMNDEDLPQLRLNSSYKRLLHRDAAEKDVRNYVKERYKSAIQLIKNIEQRKQTILKVCQVIISRQRDFLDQGIDQLKPMMIKEVAEEIGVHPSTVSRAVANKYAHTAQGVFELRYFFSESVNGPEGGGTSLLILKRRVKKLIEEEDSSRPLTDEQITRILQSQGIQVTRRTVAKYREDMKIPSTHQRRVKK